MSLVGSVRRLAPWVALLTTTSLLSGCALLATSMPDHPEHLTNWTATPTTADPEFIAVATDRCTDPAQGEPRILIHDQRGPDTAEFIVRSGDLEVECRLMRHLDGVVRPVTMGISSPSDPQRRLVLWRSGVESDGRGLVVSSHRGSAGRGTERVEIELVDGDVIEATVSGGRFLAFWPGDEPSVEVRALDADGKVLRRIPGSDRDSSGGRVGALAAPSAQPSLPSLPTQGWTTAPVEPDAAARAIADVDCIEHLPPDAELLVQDQRGTDGALFLYRTPGDAVDYSCFVGSEPDGVLRWSQVTTGIPRMIGDLHPFEVPVMRLLTEDASPVGTVVGAVPEGATRVEVELLDGTRIEASLAEGRYVAWWPSDAWVATVTAFDSDGTELQQARGSFNP